MNLIEATETQKIARDPLTYEAWGQKLTLDQYLKREIELRQTPWCQKNQKTWILESPGGTPLASCETLKMQSFLDSTPSLPSLGIASVYTAPEFRGKGFASLLIEKLIGHLRNGREKYHAIVLFSEVGARIYERLGFTAVPSDEFLIKIKSPLSEDQQFVSPLEKISRLNKSSNINTPTLKISTTDFLDNLSFYLAFPKTKFCIWPDKEQLFWNWKRQDLYADFLNKNKIKNIGVRLNNSFILWMVDYKYNILRILLLSTNHPLEKAQLIQAACDEAQALGLPQVSLWATEEDQELQNNPHSDLNLCKEPREDAIAMILPLSPTLTPHDWSHITRAIWV